jgi:UDP-glucose:(heptosyl)LPS alpha-1,3-glucosyltransferase
VSLAGEVDNVHSYLQAADVFVFPSEFEGFGISIIEALACGLPAVVTRVGIALEIIETYKNGILIGPKNPQELHQAMDWLLEHRDLWGTIGMNARNSITEKFSMDAVAGKYLEMFLELQRA